MTFLVRYTGGARRALVCLYEFLLERDIATAERALDALRKSTEILQEFPFTCRKADDSNPFLRELIVPFGSSGYVVLFEIDDATTVTILAVRHQREEDYH
ncbi:MAG TPA: type II toxin-antitoxin system RelE/ParE family toxin [Paraburkholderia sp.]|uniref:type II toxin-antitoxin system RelE/ParE family toxin n=1 Tax=Paraburkholderia sp. TaxID=1926495 RepID=UPI002B46F0BF|nr:type II toxin-antitoxin system RelE/ParE family toxin [Paraburkholderia sp.]HKR46404.1 type II toxin-antitoxin system RelE/ParE family toxin [Paraburkholderia sp.]